MNERMDFIKEESIKLGESIQLSCEVTDLFNSSTAGYGDGFALATLTRVIVRYCDSRGIGAEEFVNDLARSVELMAKYRY